MPNRNRVMMKIMMKNLVLDRMKVMMETIVMILKNRSLAKI